MDGNRLYKEDIVSYVKRELTRRREERRSTEMQWILNANFMAGHQNCDLNNFSGEIEDYVPTYDYLERGVYNRIAPLIQTRIANLRTVRYGMAVRPRTDELDDFEKADVSTKLLRYSQDMVGFDDLVDTAYQWSALTGTAFFYSWWDTSLGEVIQRIESVEVDEEGAVVQAREEHYGDLNCGLLTPYEVYPEDLYKEKVKDQRSILVEQILSVEDVYDLYGFRANRGEDIESYALMPTNGAGGNGFMSTTYRMERVSKKNAVRVITYFEKRSRMYPDGRMIILIGDELFRYGTLPYREIPLVAVKDQVVAGQFYGKSVIQDLIPLQRAYNGCKNKIHDYIQTVATNPMAVPVGSTDVEDLETNGIAPGRIISYDPQRGGKPELLAYPALPSTVLNEVYQLSADMEYVAGVSQLMVVGAAPTGVTSGAAIDNLRQIDNTRLSITAESFRGAIRALAKQWLYIYKDRATGHRVLNISGEDGIGGVYAWCSDDINSFDVEFDTENELKNSEENQKNNFLSAWQMGLFADESGRVPREIRLRAWELLKIGNVGALLAETDLQRKNAQRENIYFEAGSIPKVDDLDDHEIHGEVHRRFALSQRFRLMERKSPEYAKAFRDHLREHGEILAKRAAKAMAMQSGNNE